jgi:hypothetical protein
MIFRYLHPPPAREACVFGSSDHEHKDQIPARGQERIGIGEGLPGNADVTLHELKLLLRVEG